MSDIVRTTIHFDTVDDYMALFGMNDQYISLIQEEWFAPKPVLFICGGGHVAKELAELAAEGKVQYAMVPVWILTTRYNKKPYTFMMNGQTGKMVGSLPYSSGKSWMYFLITFIVCAVLLYFIFKFAM